LPFLAARQLPGPPFEEIGKGKFLIGVESELIGLRVSADPRFKPAVKASFSLVANLSATLPAVALDMAETSEIVSDRVVHFPISELVPVEIGSKP
jgi:hypothetical protein